jgi:hypothetical protein
MSLPTGSSFQPFEKAFEVSADEEFVDREQKKTEISRQIYARFANSQRTLSDESRSKPVIVREIKCSLTNELTMMGIVFSEVSYRCLFVQSYSILTEVRSKVRHLIRKLTRPVIRNPAR